MSGCGTLLVVDAAAGSGPAAAAGVCQRWTAGRRRRVDRERISTV